MFAEGMLWGHVVRSPHPAARIRAVDVSGALKIPGVRAVLTSDDVPGRKTYGLDYPDQPVFAWDCVRYMGEAVAAVAADHPETARRAAAAVVVDYVPTAPLTDSTTAEDAEPVHPLGQRPPPPEGALGRPGRHRGSVVEGYYETGMQDQAPLGPESGLAVPAEDGGIDLYIATQWLHIDQEQMAACLALPLDKVRVHLAGVGGSFGAREDLSMQIQICLLALRDGAAGEDHLLARGVVSRPCAPAPGQDVVPPPRRRPRGGSSSSRRRSSSTGAPTSRARWRWS